jgi:hypothetical protein
MIRLDISKWARKMALLSRLVLTMEMYSVYEICAVVAVPVFPLYSHAPFLSNGAFRGQRAVRQNIHMIRRVRGVRVLPV